MRDKTIALLALMLVAALVAGHAALQSIIPQTIPFAAPIFAFGTVVILSTINRQTARRPFVLSGSMGKRNKGASVGSVVKAHIVTESVPSNRSS